MIKLIEYITFILEMNRQLKESAFFVATYRIKVILGKDCTDNQQLQILYYKIC